VVDYTIAATQIEAFEAFARRWIQLVNQCGGHHHGYFLPAEGASDKALALFSFPSLAAYEDYRTSFGIDPEFIEADRIREESGCVVPYERTFMRPLLPTDVLWPGERLKTAPGQTSSALTFARNHGTRSGSASGDVIYSAGGSQRDELEPLSDGDDVPGPGGRPQ